jgi:phosphoribosylglycinamide formyltransferase 1
MGQSEKQKIAVFASGSGTNFENLATYFHAHSHIVVDCLVVNNSNAFAVERAKKLNITTFEFLTKEEFVSGKVTELLKSREIRWVVLAGFLWLIPPSLIQAFPNRIINIHPALLPKFGGKGMYGLKVHQAVKDSGESSTGITIHLVNEKYDEGEILFQAACPVQSTDSAEDIAHRIHNLEYRYYPQVVEEQIRKESNFS